MEAIIFARERDRRHLRPNARLGEAEWRFSAFRGDPIARLQCFSEQNRTRQHAPIRWRQSVTSFAFTRGNAPRAAGRAFAGVAVLATVFAIAEAHAQSQDKDGGATDTPPATARLFLLSGQSNMANLDPDISFTPTLRDAFPEDEIIVIKVAYGGRAIARWVPRGMIYGQLLEKAKQATAGKDIATVTFVWMQGERDHQEDTTTRTYGANLKSLYQQLTEDLDRDDIDWVIGRLSDARLGTPNWDTIRQVQVDVAKGNPRAAWVDTDDLNGPTNAVHCPPEGYKEMGRRFARAAIDLIRKPARTSSL